MEAPQIWLPQLESQLSAARTAPAVCSANAAAPAVKMNYFPGVVEPVFRPLFNQIEIIHSIVHAFLKIKNLWTKHTHHRLKMPLNRFPLSSLTSEKSPTQPREPGARCPWCWLRGQAHSLSQPRDRRLTAGARALGAEGDTSLLKCPRRTAGCLDSLSARPKYRIPCASVPQTCLNHTPE